MNDPFKPLTEQEIEEMRVKGRRWPLQDERLSTLCDMALASLSLPTPGCGHPSQYAYSEDGGKRIVCLLCERAAQPEERATPKVPECCYGGKLNILCVQECAHIKPSLWPIIEALQSGPPQPALPAEPTDAVLETLGMFYGDGNIGEQGKRYCEKDARETYAALRQVVGAASSPLGTIK